MPKFLQTIVGLLILIWTNALILFGLNISPAKEAALETIVNTVALAGFLIYGAVHTYARHVDPSVDTSGN
jgi:hypothetical protein